MKYPVSEEKCAGCSCCQLITDTFCNVSHMDPRDYYYGCAAGVEDDCRGTESDADS
jgi:hypothetical protein